MRAGARPISYKPCAAEAGRAAPEPRQACGLSPSPADRRAAQAHVHARCHTQIRAHGRRTMGPAATADHAPAGPGGGSRRRPRGAGGWSPCMASTRCAAGPGRPPTGLPRPGLARRSARAARPAGAAPGIPPAVWRGPARAASRPPDARRAPAGDYGMSGRAVPTRGPRMMPAGARAGAAIASGRKRAAGGGRGP